MTAEERVRWLIQFLPTSPGNFDQQRAFLACAAQMVRAAENDALERVVGVLVGCWCDEYGGMTREDAEATSEVVLIRSLQSKPPEGK